MNKVGIYCLAMFFLSLFGLVHTKMHVQSLRESIDGMEDKKAKLIESVRVLKAEWSYLNKLDRLESLSDQYLKLSKIDLNKIKSMSDKRDEIARIEKVKYNKTLQNNANWRYKPRQITIPTNSDAKKK